MVRCEVCLGFVLVALLAIADAKIYDKCELARELSRSGIPRSELPDWVCVAQYESSFNTALVNNNSNGSKDWGLFQINDRWWCNPGDGRKTHNSCKVDCSDLKTDDISKAVTCARQIKRERKGFTAWVAWNKRCQKNKPTVNECF